LKLFLEAYECTDILATDDDTVFPDLSDYNLPPAQQRGAGEI
jgi:hypothetical protein